MSDQRAMTTIHATCVSLDDKAVVICGAAGSGKSALALQLMSLGMTLVSDDRTELRKENATLVASAPPAITGLIEARGVGIMQAKTSDSVKVVLVIDLDKPERKRLPERHHVDLCGVSLPCLHKVEGSHFPAAILLYLQSGRRDPE